MAELHAVRRVRGCLAGLLAASLLVGACNSGGSSGPKSGASSSTTSASPVRPIDWNAVDDAIGRKGDVMAGDVHRYSFPRTDLKVTLDGTALKPSDIAADFNYIKDPKTLSPWALCPTMVPSAAGAPVRV